jgi:hypothetical protein
MLYLFLDSADLSRASPTARSREVTVQIWGRNGFDGVVTVRGCVSRCFALVKLEAKPTSANNNKHFALAA